MDNPGAECAIALFENGGLDVVVTGCAVWIDAGPRIGSVATTPLIGVGHHHMIVAAGVYRAHDGVDESRKRGNQTRLLILHRHRVVDDEKKIDLLTTTGAGCAITAAGAAG